MASQTIIIKQGDSTTLTETITGMSSLSGFTAKLYIKDSTGVATDTIIGTINDLVITYEIYNDASRLYPVKNHYFETKLFNANDLVCTLSEGVFTVEKSLEADPKAALNLILNELGIPMLDENNEYLLEE